MSWLKSVSTTLRFVIIFVIVVLVFVAVLFIASRLQFDQPEMAQAQEVSEPMLTEPTVVIDGVATTTWIDIDVPYRSASVIETCKSWSLEDGGVLVVRTKDDRVIIIGGDFLARIVK